MVSLLNTRGAVQLQGVYFEGYDVAHDGNANSNDDNDDEEEEALQALQDICLPVAKCYNIVGFYQDFILIMQESH